MPFLNSFLPELDPGRKTPKGTHSATGGRQALLLARGFGRHAPEASVGRSRDSEKALRLRYQKREALAPAPSKKKPVAYDSKRSARAPRPGHLRVFTPDPNPLGLPTRD